MPERIGREKSSWSNTERGATTVSKVDGLDQDVEPLVIEVCRKLTSELRLEKISLLSPEAAEDALTVLSKVQGNIDRQMKSLLALRKVMEQKKDER